MAKENADVRILAVCHIDGKRYEPNQLVRLDATGAKALVKDGKADDSKASLDYLAGEGVKPIEHKAPGKTAKAKDEEVEA
jgi:hypothetical protein